MTTYPWGNVVWCLIFVAVASAIEETVNTTSGVVRGTRVQGTNVIKFLGIPYAEPPIGERRFKRPVRKTRMTGTFDATTNGFACPQIIPEFSGGDFAFLSVNFSRSEDCLNLNVFVPATASKSAPLSVMVWIYGGGYATGAASLYDSTLLAGYNDVIVVVVNYRLGILGFLNTMDDNSVGNFGLRDQCLALFWVNQNIAEFGGNASSVTIFGESAGAGSVTQLTMAAKCEGLFQRVISQSGSPLAPWSHNPDPLKSAQELGSRMGCSTSNTTSLVQCLRGKSVDELLKHQSLEVHITGQTPWVPSYSGDFFSFVPKELPLWSGIPVVNTMNKFDLLTGVNWEEGDAFYELIVAESRAKGQIHDKTDGLPDMFLNQSFTEVARALLPGDTSRADKLLPSLRFRYTDWKDPHNKFSNSKMLVQLIGDTYIHVGSVQYARLHDEFGRQRDESSSETGRTYFYRLKHRGSWLSSRPWTIGASHGGDVSFLFGALFVGLFNSTAEEKYLSHAMMEYWTNFAKIGNPNEPSKRYIVTPWPTYSMEEEEYIELDINMARDSTRKHPYAKRVAFWDQLITEEIKLFQNEGISCKTTSSPTTTTAHKDVVPELPVIVG